MKFWPRPRPPLEVTRELTISPWDLQTYITTIIEGGGKLISVVPTKIDLVTGDVVKVTIIYRRTI